MVQYLPLPSLLMGRAKASNIEEMEGQKIRRLARSSRENDALFFVFFSLAVSLCQQQCPRSSLVPSSRLCVCPCWPDRILVITRGSLAVTFCHTRFREM